MARNQDDNEPKKSRARRAAGFFARRGGIHRAFEASRFGADFIYDLAERVRPKALDSKGLTGRYDDGGIERFQEMARSISASQLQRQHEGWRTQRSCFLYAGLVAVLAIPVGLIFFDISRVFVIGLVALFLFSMFRAVRADFFAWIIEQGRFGGFYDYLTSRLPRNMQIILPGRKQDK
ncbi:hypothetical protein [Roseovarius sp. M141]|uniref:hypothetical protein n=1 Tax=Roseovarius sp. M141 TaxID=2583806 RepID=UPI0020CD4C86|nr:hypothetical protein [Roseovarius sp. M141]MCQ0090354.1 hypothetical protein [Roseovarius sp. M141]